MLASFLAKRCMKWARLRRKDGFCKDDLRIEDNPSSPRCRRWRSRVTVSLCFGVWFAWAGSLLLAKRLPSGFAGCSHFLLPLVVVQITGNKTSGGPREPHSSGAKQVCATRVITLPIIWHALGIHTCQEGCKGEVTSLVGTSLLGFLEDVGGKLWPWEQVGMNT